MAGSPDPEFLSVEGPQFVRAVEAANVVTRRLEANNWDFDGVPDVLARGADCDVAAKEIVNIFDGRTQTRHGRLVMRGVGARFNLMSHEPPTANYLGPRSEIFDLVNRQIGSRGLEDYEAFRSFGRLQRVDLVNPTLFYQARDVVFWNTLHRTGLFPTGLEDVNKQFIAGNVIRNLVFVPSVAARRSEPVAMEAFATVSFPTPVLEWMQRPLYGGISPDTIHIETLLTIEPHDLSHPYLPLVAEGQVMLDGRTYAMRRFAGVAPKDATRGPGVPEEGVSA